MSETTQEAPPTWYAGLDAEHVGHIQERGLDKLDAAAAAVKLAQMHRQARVSMGLSEDQILRLPKDMTDSEGMKPVWQKLGAPADPKDYSFEGVQAGDVTGSLVDTLRAAAAGVNMPKAMAAEVAKSVAGWINQQTEAYTTETAGNAQAAEDAIRKSWGADYEAHNFVANQGQKALQARLGERLAPQLDQAMDVLKSAGLGELGREMMRVVGAGLGEDKFVGGSGPSGRAVMTRDMAVARKAELMADGRWIARYTSGDTDARKEMSALNILLSGE